MKIEGKKMSSRLSVNDIVSNSTVALLNSWIFAEIMYIHPLKEVAIIVTQNKTLNDP